MLTKKYYKAIAKIIVTCKHRDLGTEGIFISKQDLLYELKSFFYKDNPKFDMSKFRQACLPNLFKG